MYFGHYDGAIDVNEREISEWRFVDLASMDTEIASAPERFTPWLKMEWAQITNSHLDDILQSARSRASGETD